MKKIFCGGFRFCLILLICGLALFAFGCGSAKPTATTDAPQVNAEAKSESSAKQSSAEESDAEQTGGVAARKKLAAKIKEAKKESAERGGYTMQDVARLERTENFAPGALEHIFDGTINKKGKATGYHYSMIADSKGKIVEGTRKRADSHGVFTGKVEVDGVPKNGFSSFYPESWSPQEVVDAINTAYKDALANPQNPHDRLWIGYDGDLEIDMYLNDNRKIVTAYPIYAGKNNAVRN